jgi:hypothetical protein
MTFSGGFGRVFRPVFDPGLAARNGLLNALIAYWPMNEAGGANNALDTHSNGLTLTQTGDPGSDTGKVYSAARTFVPIDYFSRASETLLQVGGADWTMALWVYTTAISDLGNWLVNKRGSGTTNAEYQIFISKNFGTYRFGSWSGTTPTAFNGPAPNLNTWEFVVAWFVSATNTMYLQVNNGTVESAAAAGAINTTTQPFGIGTGIWGPAEATSHQGRLGPIAYWKSSAGNGGVLTQAQRDALWNAGNGLAYTAFTT